MYREGENQVWYYSSKAAVEELLASLDIEHWETELLSSLGEMKEDIIKQVNITEELTAANKGSKKSIMEIETGQHSL
jgi:nucleosome-remodeling factor subunit BPTF